MSGKPLFCSIWLVLVYTSSVDGGSITWYEPPPVVTEAVVSVPSIAGTTRLFRGVDGSLSWNFTLRAEQFDSARILWKALTVANIRSSGFFAVVSSYKHRFNLTWISSQRATLIVFNVSTEYEGDFSFETTSFADGNYKTWIRRTTVNVVAPSKIRHTSENQTVNQNDRVYLNCTAEGLPTSNISWTRLSDNSVVFMPLTITGRKDQGSYRCTAYNGIGDPATGDVFITVQNYSADYAVLTSSLNNDTAVVNEVFNITCRTDANPPATFRFYKDGKSVFNNITGTNVAVHSTSVSERRSPVSYSCIPFNEYGDGPTATVTITVHYPPKIVNFTSEISANLSSTVPVECMAEANPNPSYVWTNTLGGIESRVGTLTIEKVNDLDGRVYNYTCTATNPLGSDNRTVSIKIKRHRVRVELVITKVDGKVAVYDSSKEDEIKKKIKQKVVDAYRNDSNFKEIREITIRNGSIIASFGIVFKNPVTLNEGLATLREAISNGTLGPFAVNTEVIIVPDVTPTTAVSVSSTGSTTTPVKTVDKTTSGPEERLPWAIIGGAIGGGVVLVIIFVVVAWWVHKKRKCRRKNSKIHNSESEVLRNQNHIEDGAYARVSSGYAVSGPPSANASQAPKQQQRQQQVAAAPPAYAVVDKSKKKNKDKKNGNENIPDYAVVDKSKKKKKKEAENSKKKLKPGEMVYADLGDFQPVGQMPAVSTSPEPLPPIKRPPSYQETAYADITQFVKGDATLSAGQGTEIEPTYANSGRGQGADTKENPNTGQEDTRSKETPM